jgi:hypothetical protein
MPWSVLFTVVTFLFVLVELLRLDLVGLKSIPLQRPSRGGDERAIVRKFARRPEPCS